MKISYINDEDIRRIKIKLGKARLSSTNPVACTQLKNNHPAWTDEAVLRHIEQHVGPATLRWLVEHEYNHELSIQQAHDVALEKGARALLAGVYNGDHYTPTTDVQDSVCRWGAKRLRELKGVRL